MRAEFASQQLRCPWCKHDRTLRLEAGASDAHEVRDGTLRCDNCAREFAVDRGVGLLMPSAPEHVFREAEGLERFADLMRSDGWDTDKIRALPDIDSGYWYVQGRSIRQLMALVDLRPGQRLVDVGSNTCWASNQFARLGLQVTSLDIATAEMQGLYSGDFFIADGSVYFERVQGSMYDMPLATGSLDYVFCCEVLHHNDEDSLKETFKEAYRVLKPGGKVLVINETLKTLKDPVGVHVEGVEQFEGYEHAFWAAQYRWAATRAGFLTRMVEPCYHWFFDLPPDPVRPPLGLWRKRAQWELKRHRLGRQAYLSWLNHARGGVQMNMIATKPARFTLPSRASRSR